MPVGSDNQGCYLSNLQGNLAWRDKVLAAVLEKTVIASDATRLTPRPPSLTGKEA